MEKKEIKNIDSKENPLNFLSYNNNNHVTSEQGLGPVESVKGETVNDNIDIQLCFSCNIEGWDFKKCTGCLEHYCLSCIRDDGNTICNNCEMVHKFNGASKYNQIKIDKTKILVKIS